MKSREGCCADTRKPCSYHEGCEDGMAFGEAAWNGALNRAEQAEAQRDSWEEQYTVILSKNIALEGRVLLLATALYKVATSHGGDLGALQDIATRALAALDKPKIPINRDLPIICPACHQGEEGHTYSEFGRICKPKVP